MLSATIGGQVDPSVAVLATQSALLLMRLFGWPSKQGEGSPSQGEDPEASALEAFETAASSESGKRTAEWLLGKLDSHPGVRPGLAGVLEQVRDPDGADAGHVRQRVVAELTESFAAEPALRAAVAERVSQLSVTASGPRSVAIGRDNHGSINTGDVSGR